MSDLSDQLDLKDYAQSSASADLALPGLGFTFQGINTSHPEDPRNVWYKRDRKRMVHIAVTSASNPTRLDYYKRQLAPKETLVGAATRVAEHPNLTVAELRRLLNRWTEAQEIIHLMLDAETDAYDPKADLNRLFPNKCPECGSTNISGEVDDEGLLDCFNCGIWFDPLHPNNAPGRPGNFPETPIVDEAVDNPDDPKDFMASLPAHPTAMGMRQDNEAAAYWKYLFKSREGYSCRLTLSHSALDHPHGGSHTVSLDVGGWRNQQMHRVLTRLWQGAAGFTKVDLDLRSAADRFIKKEKAVKRGKRLTVAELEQLWQETVAPLGKLPGALPPEMPEGGIEESAGLPQPDGLDDPRDQLSAFAPSYEDLGMTRSKTAFVWYIDVGEIAELQVSHTNTVQNPNDGWHAADLDFYDTGYLHVTADWHSPAGFEATDLRMRNAVSRFMKSLAEPLDKDSVRSLWHKTIGRLHVHESQEDPPVDDPRSVIASADVWPDYARLNMIEMSPMHWRHSFVDKEGTSYVVIVAWDSPENSAAWGREHLIILQTFDGREHLVSVSWKPEQFTTVAMQVWKAVKRFMQAPRSAMTDEEVLHLWNQVIGPLQTPTAEDAQQESQESEIPDPKEYLLTHTRPREPRVRISYAQTTPESAEQGDTSETGWIDEEGKSMELDEWDIETEATLASKTAAFLQSEGATHASSSHFHPGVWYSTDYQTIDYATCTDEERCFHLVDFTEEEEKEIWRLMHQRRH